MLVINPDECIDCGVCEPECPIEAIKSDEELDAKGLFWAELNRKYSAIWPSIKETTGPLPTAQEASKLTAEEKKELFSGKAGE